MTDPSRYRKVWYSMFAGAAVLVLFFGGCTKRHAGISEGIEISDHFIESPAAKAEDIPKSPSPEHVWVPGHWERQSGEWHWRAGRWQKPPHGRAHWRAGHWSWQEGKWHWARGHWAVAPALHELLIFEELVPIPGIEEEEIVTKAPSSEHVWVPGYWERDFGKWAFEPGHWEKPPHKSARWHPGHWRWQEGKSHWVHGHWSNGPPSWIVDELLGIPEPLAEHRPEKPSDKNHWVTGHWDWDGKWLWIPGYWTSLPHPDAEWVKGHWAEWGEGHWRWIAGHWTVK